MVSLAPREFPASFAVDIGEPAGDDQQHRPDRDAAEQYWGWFPEKAGGAGGSTNRPDRTYDRTATNVVYTQLAATITEQ